MTVQLYKATQYQY